MADGGACNGGYGSGGGAGGRIAIYSCDNQLSYDRISARGGCGWSCGEDGSVFVPSDGLAILDDPASQVAKRGQTISFAVDVEGYGPFAYEWFKDRERLANGGRVSGASTSTITIKSVELDDAGIYHAVVRNECGEDRIRKAKLIVEEGEGAPPTIIEQPVPQTACEGFLAEFRVTATGDGTLSYQRRKDGISIPDATEATYQLSETQRADRGIYDVVVSSGFGAATSDPASLVLFIRGDSNGDDSVDFDDIDCFVASLVGEDNWQNCGTILPADAYDCVNDANRDGSVDFDDIDGFVECLINGGCPLRMMPQNRGSIHVAAASSAHERCSQNERNDRL